MNNSLSRRGNASNGSVTCSIGNKVEQEAQKLVKHTRRSLQAAQTSLRGLECSPLKKKAAWAHQRFQEIMGMEELSQEDWKASVLPDCVLNGTSLAAIISRCVEQKIQAKKVLLENVLDGQELLLCEHHMFPTFFSALQAHNRTRHECETVQQHETTLQRQVQVQTSKLKLAEALLAAVKAIFKEHPVKSNGPLASICNLIAACQAADVCVPAKLKSLEAHLAALSVAGSLNCNNHSTDNWHWTSEDGSTQGPFSVSSLAAWHCSGHLQSTDMVWNGRPQDAVPLRQVLRQPQPSEIDAVLQKEAAQKVRERLAKSCTPELQLILCDRIENVLGNTEMLQKEHASREARARELQEEATKAEQQRLESDRLERERQEECLRIQQAEAERSAEIARSEKVRAQKHRAEREANMLLQARHEAANRRRRLAELKLRASEEAALLSSQKCTPPQQDDRSLPTDLAVSEIPLLPKVEVSQLTGIRSPQSSSPAMEEPVSSPVQREPCQIAPDAAQAEDNSPQEVITVEEDKRDAPESAMPEYVVKGEADSSEHMKCQLEEAPSCSMEVALADAGTSDIGVEELKHVEDLSAVEARQEEKRAKNMAEKEERELRKRIIREMRLEAVAQAKQQKEAKAAQKQEEKRIRAERRLQRRQAGSGRHLKTRAQQKKEAPCYREDTEESEDEEEDLLSDASEGLPSNQNKQFKARKATKKPRAPGGKRLTAVEKDVEMLKAQMQSIQQKFSRRRTRQASVESSVGMSGNHNLRPADRDGSKSITSFRARTPDQAIQPRKATTRSSSFQQAASKPGIRNKRKREADVCEELVNATMEYGSRAVKNHLKQHQIAKQLKRRQEAAGTSQQPIPADVAESKAAHPGRRDRASRRFMGPDDYLFQNKLKTRAKDVRFGRSPVHAWGLFAKAKIAPEEFIIEYVGEIIRGVLSDVREAEYNASGLGSSYLFRVDDEVVVDATKRGGLARYINHSCDPNCYTKIVPMEGHKHIMICSKTVILPGQELLYDYKFPYEEDQDPVPCHCGAHNCRGRLN